jgi:predicted metal-dependent phosphoesterase TrpH
VCCERSLTVLASDFEESAPAPRMVDRYARAGWTARCLCAAAAALAVLAGVAAPASAQGLPSASSLRFQRLHRADSPFLDPLWTDPWSDRRPRPDPTSGSVREVYALLATPGAGALPKASAGAASAPVASLPPPVGAAPISTAQPGLAAPPAAPDPGPARKQDKDRAAGLAERLVLPGHTRSVRIQPPAGFAAVDLHVHTWFSPDSTADPEQMLLAAARRGLAGIAVTDHNTVAGAERALALAGPLKTRGSLPASFFIIKGEEVGSRDGHIIALFLHATVPPGLSAAETVAAIHAQGGLAVAAHPLLRSGVGSLVLSLPFDAVESENIAEELHFSVGSTAANRRRTLFYRSVTLPVVGVSDAHDPSVVGLGYTLVPAADLDEAGVRQALAGHSTRAGMLSPARHLRRVAEATARPASSVVKELHRLLLPGNKALRGMTGADWASLRPGLIHGSLGWSLRLTRRF